MGASRDQTDDSSQRYSISKNVIFLYRGPWLLGSVSVIRCFQWLLRTLSAWQRLWRQTAASSSQIFFPELQRCCQSLVFHSAASSPHSQSVRRLLTKLLTRVERSLLRWRLCDIRHVLQILNACFHFFRLYHPADTRLKFISDEQDQYLDQGDFCKRFPSEFFHSFMANFSFHFCKDVEKLTVKRLLTPVTFSSSAAVGEHLWPSSGEPEYEDTFHPDILRRFLRSVLCCCFLGFSDVW